VRASADEEIGIVAGRKVAQDLRDALGGQLPRSASARSIVDQTFFPAKKQHVYSTKGVAKTPRTPREERENTRTNASLSDSQSPFILFFVPKLCLGMRK
jgi:hypothetical protein